MSQSGCSNTLRAGIHPGEEPKSAQHAEEEVRPTQVWFVQGKEANKNFRTALTLHRENATLHEKSHVYQSDLEQDKPEEAQHDDAIE